MSQLTFQNTEIAFRSKSNLDLRRSYFIFRLLNHPWLVSLGSICMRAALSLHLPVKPLIRSTIFRQFCGGETLEESLSKARELAEFRVGTILDVAVEGSQEERAFEEATQEILRTIHVAENNPAIPFCVFKLSGIAPFAVMERLQQKVPLSPEEERQWAASRARVERIGNLTYQKKVRLLIDAEESWVQDVIDELATEMMQKFNREQGLIYNTIQMYRHDRLSYLKRSYAEASKEGYFLGLKIVRGAYLEKESKRALELGVPSPIHKTKEDTDRDYNESLRFSVENIQRIVLCAGTHNEVSTQFLIDLMKEKGISPTDERIYFSQLYGMSDHLSYNLAASGYLVAKYLPYGEVNVLMPYLIRRAQENTAIHGQTPRELLLLKQEIRRRQNVRLRS